MLPVHSALVGGGNTLLFSGPGKMGIRNLDVLILFYVIPPPAYNSVNAGSVNLAEKEGRVNNSDQFQGKGKKWREIRILFGGGLRVVKTRVQKKCGL